MPLLQIVILAIIQGITEFLPVSSSAHLILIPYFLKWPAQGLAMDVAVHIGTLLAVILYFRQTIFKMILNLPAFFQRRWKNPHARLTLWLIIGTFPSVCLGTLLSEIGMHKFQSMKIIGYASIIYGLLLYFVDKYSSSHRVQSDMTFKDVMKIGLAQSLALIPGTSRSGICITMARYLGFNRVEAAKFSFLLSIPVISAAALLTGYKTFKTGYTDILYDLLIGISLSFLSGLLTIHFMMKCLRIVSFRPFIIYRLCLGIFLVWVTMTHFR